MKINNSNKDAEFEKNGMNSNEDKSFEWRKEFGIKLKNGNLNETNNLT